MKKIYTLTIALLSTVTTLAQTPNYLWAKSAGGTEDEHGNNVYTDTKGNVFVTGTFTSETITFGSTTLINKGRSDVFIVKYDIKGNVLWAKDIGGTNYEEGQSICTDAHGNVFVIGYYFSPTISFGKVTLSNKDTIAYSSTTFLVKYDALGNVLWAQNPGGASNNIRGRNLCTDANNNVIVTGNFWGASITFDNVTLTNMDNSGNTTDIFLVKYDSEGKVLWAKNGGGNGSDEGLSVCTDKNSNIIVTGASASYTIKFGTISHYSSGGKDAFLAKCDSFGNEIWLKRAGDSGDDICTSVCADINGNIFVTGSFSSNSISFEDIYLTKAMGHCNVFLVKYDASGNVLWAKRAGDYNSSDKGNNVSTDGKGNVFLIGEFDSPNITFGTNTIFNADSTGKTKDIFFVKYNASGDIIWTERAGGTTNDSGFGTVNSNGNIIITGYFNSPTINFGTTIVSNKGRSDFFVVQLDSLTKLKSSKTKLSYKSKTKFEAQPTPLWTKNGQGNASNAGHSVCTDSNGNVFVMGYFWGANITFGATTLTNSDTSGKTKDIFLVKYDTLGNVLWAKSAGGTYYDEGSDLASDASGNVFVTGYFKSPIISFGPITLINSIDKPSDNSSDFFLVKYDPSGNVQWAKSAGGTHGDYGWSICTDANGNLLISGSFYSYSIKFGTAVLINNSNSSDDIFLVKYDSSGNVLWAKREGGAGDDYGWDISVDGTNNILITGCFYSPIITFGNITLNNMGNHVGRGSDIFVVKYNSMGKVIWAKSAGGTNLDEGKSISTDATNNVFVTGNFRSSSIVFGTTTLVNSDTNKYPTKDMFLLKYDALGNELWAKNAGGNSADEGNNISVDKDGNVLVAGLFTSPVMTLSKDTLMNTDISGNTNDVFLIKYDKWGNVLWSNSSGGIFNDYGQSASDAKHIYVTGSYRNDAKIFGTALFNSGKKDNDNVFLSKLRINSNQKK